MPTAKSRGKKGKVRGKDIDEEDEQDLNVKGAAASPPGAVERHHQYRVAQVLFVDPVKRKPKLRVCELQTGSETIPCLTAYTNVAPGHKVILAPEGSTVSGTKVEGKKIAGEWTFGVICGPKEMGWPGDASKALILNESFNVGPQVGDFAPVRPEASADGSTAKTKREYDQEYSEEEEEEEDTSFKEGHARFNFRALVSDEDNSKEGVGEF